MTVTTVPPSVSESSFRPRVFGATPFHTDGELLALRFAPDGSLWSVEEPGVLRHWDLDARQQIGWHDLTDSASLWCFSASAHYVAAGSDELSIWETATGEQLAYWPQPSWVTALAFQPGGLLLASGHDDGVIRLWHYASQRLAYELRSPGRFRWFERQHAPSAPWRSAPMVKRWPSPARTRASCCGTSPAARCAAN